MIAEYNSEENKNLTQEGKREILQRHMFMAYVAGFNFCDQNYVEENKKLKKEILDLKLDAVLSVSPKDNIARLLKEKTEQIKKMENCFNCGRQDCNLPLLKRPKPCEGWEME